jgi:hypothetical protein
MRTVQLANLISVNYSAALAFFPENERNHLQIKMTLKPGPIKLAGTHEISPEQEARCPAEKPPARRSIFQRFAA